MSIISILVVIGVAAILFYIIDQLVADPKIRNVLRVVLVAVVLIWFLTTFLGGVGGGRVGTLDLD